MPSYMRAPPDAHGTEAQPPFPAAGGAPAGPGGSDGEASVADEGGSGEPAVRTAAEHLAQDSVEEVIGKSIAVALRPHVQITRNMLREVKTVSKGKMVKVVLDNGLMRVVMNGLAEEDGADDSVIRVRNLNSNKIIYARVVGPSLVQIDF